jgi:hypothetical protein
MVAKFKPEQKKRWQELRKQLDDFDDLHPGVLPVGSAENAPHTPQNRTSSVA